MGSYGLPWSTGRVGDFENGRAAASLPTLVAVAAALGDITGRPIKLADLFAGKGDVLINDKLTVSLAKLRAALSGEPVAVPRPPAQPPRLAGTRHYRWPINAPGAWWEGLDNKLHWRVRSDFRESDERLCKKIGIEPDLGAAAMAKLWKRTFTAKRDELAGPEANPQRRGIVARQLKAQLVELINSGEQSVSTRPWTGQRFTGCGTAHPSDDPPRSAGSKPNATLKRSPPPWKCRSCAASTSHRRSAESPSASSARRGSSASAAT